MDRKQRGVAHLWELDLYLFFGQVHTVEEC